MIKGAIMLTAPKMPSPSEAVVYTKAQNYDSILAQRIPWTEDLAGYSPWAHKDSDTTELLTFHSQSSHTVLERNTPPGNKPKRQQETKQ